ncbi:MAG: isoprenylcysteine carboxylmethyltransferase family protein [Candidatus ainarchaeum sp.]|nr:isoprenylcysteine carboxylmethyltransferase family protein [Candidatus ainarchaeum sp.]MDD3976309.1 isoprenylcysteine carboxylmethyltransferase family protein [Candidatus ainarchaeum sp.]
MYKLIFLSVFILLYYFLFSNKLTKHFNTTKETINMFKTDFWTSFYFTIFYICIMISFMYYFFYTDIYYLNLISLLWFISIIFACFLEYRGIKDLKENYYPQIKKEKYLITSGIFKIIRHPIYTSAIFLGLGIIGFLSTKLLIYLFPIILFVVIIKIEKEDIYLEKRFGKEFKKYKQMSYKLIPYLY